MRIAKENFDRDLPSQEHLMIAW